ncbi:MAG: tRNA (adenosine(37)-N6)-dimethylallyltransferase MiaA [Rhodospirillales bacterium]
MMTATHERTALIVAGPTASGKSGLAMAVAEEFDGVVINADSMQVYNELHIVTARPSEADEACVPHRLYGCLPASTKCSVGDWLGLAAPVIEETLAQGRLPVVTGGTGMYLKMLIEGIADVPPIPDDVRAQVSAAYRDLGGPAFRERLMAVDPQSAARLGDGDRQRLVRAMEVFEATGRPLSAWLAAGNASVVDGIRFVTLVIEPDREVLYEAIDRRFDAMIDAGAVDEVREFLALGLDRDLPAMKAVGIRELGSYLAGELNLQSAVGAAQQASRNYAKRQLTWFRNQIQKDFLLNEQYSKSLNEKIFSFIRRNGLTGSM